MHTKRRRQTGIPGAAPLLVLLVAPSVSGAQAAEATVVLPAERAIAAAEGSLREGEIQLAESRYRTALLEGWLLEGALAAADGRLDAARDAFERASLSASENRRALRALGIVQMHAGQAADAVATLTRVAAMKPDDVEARRVLAQALAAAGQPEQAVQELEEARGHAPHDIELAFALATGYLRLKKLEPAQKLFGEILAARPIPQTHVLFGRVYRDFGFYEQARAELRRALELAPKVRRAHYYLGMLALSEEGRLQLDEGISEFRQELLRAPDDPLANMRLGMALVEAKRPEEALGPLQIATSGPAASADAFHYLGRCQLALGHAEAAVGALRRVLDLSAGRPVDEFRLGAMHYVLAQALRQTGAEAEAAKHFAEAERSAERRTAGSRERLAAYLADAPEPEDELGRATMPVDVGELSELPSDARGRIEARTRTSLARAYLNLGVVYAQKKQFERAGDLLQQGAAIEPDFPQIQYSLGVARFNARQFAEATGPLTRALESGSDSPELRRMLAMAWLNSEQYEKAADLLRTDPRRPQDASLEFAYGLALVRGGHGAEAASVFSSLLARHGDSPELSVVLGQAYAQQGDFAKAEEALKRALELKPDVAEANAALGVIYLRQGRLQEAEKALRAELALRPQEPRTRQQLAAVLELLDQPDEAIGLLRAALQSKPDFVDARYLLGKILLAQGRAEEAVEHLEAAARLAPEDANVHYQLAQAYQKLQRTAQAEAQFEAFRQLKEKQRRGTP